MACFVLYWGPGVQRGAEWLLANYLGAGLGELSTRRDAGTSLLTCLSGIRYLPTLDSYSTHDIRYVCC